jgi:hypothetical protein
MLTIHKATFRKRSVQPQGFSASKTERLLSMNQHTVVYACHWKVPCALRVSVEHVWARTRMERTHADSRSDEVIA